MYDVFIDVYIFILESKNRKLHTENDLHRFVL